MANDKKNLKTVDIEDLQSLDTGGFELEEELVVDPSVSLQDLDRNRGKGSAKTSSSPGQKTQLVDNKWEDREKVLDRITARYIFDRKEWNWLGICAFFGLLMAGLIAQNIEEVMDLISFDSFSKHSHVHFRETFALEIGFVAKYYPLALFVLAILFPLKLASHHRFEISHDGIIAPSEVFPDAKPVMRRLRWSDVHSFEYIRRYGIHCAELRGSDGKSLAQLRMDIDNPAGLAKAVDKFAPSDHILRKIINN